MFKLKKSQTTLKFDELMRVSCVVSIYQALHALLPKKHVNEWFTRHNDVPFLNGETPLEYALRVVFRRWNISARCSMPQG
jgi:hypothetical protein